VSDTAEEPEYKEEVNAVLNPGRARGGPGHSTPEPAGSNRSSWDHCRQPSHISFNNPIISRTSVESSSQEQDSEHGVVGMLS
jgi:hypothetical protein